MTHTNEEFQTTDRSTDFVMTFVLGVYSQLHSAVLTSSPALLDIFEVECIIFQKKNQRYKMFSYIHLYIRSYLF